MTMLTYTVLSDPASLEASRVGPTRSTGTVYLLAANTGATAYWAHTKMTVPAGDRAGDLTPDPTTLAVTGVRHVRRPAGQTTLRVQAPATATDPFVFTDPGGRISLAPGDYLVLTLKDVPLAAAAGLAVLEIEEAASRQPRARLSTGYAAVPLVKTAAKPLPAPTAFYPVQAMVDNGDTIVLRWEGPDELDYTLLLPDGNPVPVTTPGQWTPAPGTGPKRDATYTLIATDTNTMQQYYLTTTVQITSPTFESLTATNGIHTPWVQGPTTQDAWIHFDKDGVVVRRHQGTQYVPGTLTAGKATLDGVNTEWVQGPDPQTSGWITFPPEGMAVWLTQKSDGHHWIRGDFWAKDLHHYH